MELKDWLNSINLSKEDLSENIKQYPSYIINKCLSGNLDCILYANEMNMNHHLSKDMQYAFYIGVKECLKNKDMDGKFYILYIQYGKHSDTCAPTPLSFCHLFVTCGTITEEFEETPSGSIKKKKTWTLLKS